MVQKLQPFYWRVDFAYWWSFIGGGSVPAACTAGLFHWIGLLGQFSLYVARFACLSVCAIGCIFFLRWPVSLWTYQYNRHIPLITATYPSTFTKKMTLSIVSDWVSDQKTVYTNKLFSLNKNIHLLTLIIFLSNFFLPTFFHTTKLNNKLWQSSKNQMVTIIKQNLKL